MTTSEYSYIFITALSRCQIESGDATLYDDRDTHSLKRIENSVFLQFPEPRYAIRNPDDEDEGLVGDLSNDEEDE